ncbi:jg5821 [Pararge aegeria aegeria]|uniref:Jg5821 protein n=1 Tax=Pararge aegeria aegeria TaxID=348720 RepID=A0A8S4RDI4_9NEOP|nr:jg5821 [Pararge aegeria aegeria]
MSDSYRLKPHVVPTIRLVAGPRGRFLTQLAAPAVADPPLTLKWLYKSPKAHGDHRVRLPTRGLRRVTDAEN